MDAAMSCALWVHRSAESLQFFTVVKWGNVADHKAKAQLLCVLWCSTLWLMSLCQPRQKPRWGFHQNPVMCEICIWMWRHYFPLSTLVTLHRSILFIHFYGHKRRVHSPLQGIISLGLDVKSDLSSLQSKSHPYQSSADVWPVSLTLLFFFYFFPQLFCSSEQRNLSSLKSGTWLEYWPWPCGLDF